MTLSFCPRTLRHDRVKILLWKVASNDAEKQKLCNIILPLPSFMHILDPHTPPALCSLYRNSVASAVSTVAIDHLPAQPAEFGPALGAQHVTTSSVLLDALRTIRATLG